ncbi:cotton fiber [Perilla frutescens var. hirtella]|uniref:Cotton fiber n=1 Tax=Perilla frutescens var. hirtella TaxID=608512 RepID=A0AAD4NXG3_PERFH|nr:cotton fiber [Perilla frutescens var. hirtella]KAH6815942.1 cotton fiber [Perilla frutescens var. frutescens]
MYHGSTTASFSGLRPPYLYLVINCIFITIVASSKLQPTSDDIPAPPPPVNTISAAQQQSVEISQLNFLIPTADCKYEGVEKGLELDELGLRGISKSEDSPPPSPAMGEKTSPINPLFKPWWIEGKLN